jgi:hypothetical protein
VDAVAEGMARGDTGVCGAGLRLIERDAGGCGGGSNYKTPIFRRLECDTFVHKSKIT